MASRSAGWPPPLNDWKREHLLNFLASVTQSLFDTPVRHKRKRRKSQRGSALMWESKKQTRKQHLLLLWRNQGSHLEPFQRRLRWLSNTWSMLHTVSLGIRSYLLGGLSFTTVGWKWTAEDHGWVFSMGGFYTATIHYHCVGDASITCSLSSCDFI